MTSVGGPSKAPVLSVVLSAHGGYDKIMVQELPWPDHPTSGEVLVRVHACGINFSDLLTRQGIYTFHGIRPPFTMGLECAGIVEEVAADVKDLKVGDRVMCWSFRYGMWTELVRISAQNCYPIPDSMTFEEAATIPVQYLTAYLALVDVGNLRPGQSVLIQAVAGGVGWAATQVAKSVENVTIFGTASAGKHEAVKENGVHNVIDYRTKDFVQEVKALKPDGVDIVLDCLSGSDFWRSTGLLKHLGRIITIGVSNMMTGEKRNLLQNLRVWWQMKNVSLQNLIMSNQVVGGINISTLFEHDPKRFRDGIKILIEMYKAKKIKPKIDCVYTFGEVINGTKRLVDRQNIGKVILVPRRED